MGISLCNVPDFVKRFTRLKKVILAQDLALKNRC